MGDRYVLGCRSVMTTPQRSRTAFSLLRSKSRSVVPEEVPVGVIASLTESWMMRDCATQGEEQRGADLCI